MWQISILHIKMVLFPLVRLIFDFSKILEGRESLSHEEESVFRILLKFVVS